MSTHSLKEEYELCRVGNRSHEHFKLKVDDTYVYNSSQVVSAWNPVRKYSAGMSRTGAHLRLHLEEFLAVMVCDLRLDVSGLTVLQDFLEITVVHSGEVVLPVIDVEAVVVDRVAVNTSDREEVVAEVDTADHEVVVEVDTAGLEREVAVVDTADREEVVVGEVDTADRVEIIGEEDTADREEIVAMFNGDRTFEEVDTADFGDISRMAGVGEDVEAEVVAAGVTFSEESTGSSDDTRVVICVESSDTESTRVL